MQGMHRKTAPKVKSGRVQKKNRWAETTRLDSIPLVERERPGDGYRHLLKVRDIEAFIGLLPEWDELSRGLDRIVLAAGEDGMGYHELGTVAICAWEKDLWWEDTIPSFIEEHRCCSIGSASSANSSASAGCASGMSRRRVRSSLSTYWSTSSVITTIE
jgi:hypothetical protein